MSTSDHRNTHEDVKFANEKVERVRHKSRGRRAKKSRTTVVYSRSGRRLRLVIRVVMLVGILSYIAYQFYEAIEYDQANERVEPTVEQN